MRKVKWLVSAETRTLKLWLGTHILFGTQFTWNSIITLTNMENNCIFGTEANYQTVITNFRILYISSSPICTKVVILFLLILRFLFLVSSLHSLWPCFFPRSKYFYPPSQDLLLSILFSTRDCHFVADDSSSQCYCKQKVPRITDSSSTETTHST